jgi:hypothetical protein
MTLTTHATMGALVGHASGNPVSAFIIGFIVHLLVDMIPHGDCALSDNYRVHKKNRKTAVAYVMTDAVIAIFFVLFLFDSKDIISIRNFTWGIVGSVLPDLMVGFYEITKTKYLKWFFNLHFWFHDFFVKRKGDVPLYYAILAQIVLIAYMQTKL